MYWSQCNFCESLKRCNDILHLENSEGFYGNNGDMKISVNQDDRLFSQGSNNEIIEDNDRSENVIQIGTSYGDIQSIEIIDI